ncbi:NAD(P)/FAD-dependent oxidoreductase [Arthrobacter sp. H14-L1]|uniref:NAD(P)/FAD-dependent oxidoreductase n=1 Tax=Arthrobacter sp. H14-L1 TaxID=2996697 RepID=UPI0022701641|nr:FAD-dependent oxidoreductase [Arthrobacter sp. H14-L1]MCY0903528.1 FAD-dependent oxidoreductase [Arthrobacter sp. H14-L1]
MSAPATPRSPVPDDGPENNAMVIIGAGLAGAMAAATLRTEGFAGPVILIGGEDEIPYLRPPLSKGFLAGTETADSLPVYPNTWYEEHRVELIISDAALSFDPTAHTVTLTSGRVLTYAKLLLATGAAARQLSLPGSDLAGVQYFRTRADAVALRSELAGGGRRLVLIGSGWIGMEIAASARSLGNDVTLLGLEAVPLSNVIGAELGRVFMARHEQAGVQFRVPASAAAIKGNHDGRVTGVVTSAGENLPADLVVIAVGVLPNTALAETAGLTITNGIRTDSGLRTSAADVFAAGDVANAMHPVTGEYARSEHWANAIAGGQTAARSMLGQKAALADIPYFYTDQFDLGMEYSGYAALAKSAQLVIRGSLENHEFIAFWVLDGRVVAGMNVNVWEVQDAIKELIGSGRPVDTLRLADPKTELDTL